VATAHIRLEEGIAEQRVFREIARNVLQGLILDSGLNWASDSQLRDAMLMCGEEVEWQ
jgi:Centromere protein H (CENP-H)